MSEKISNYSGGEEAPDNSSEEMPYNPWDHMEEGAKDVPESGLNQYNERDNSAKLSVSAEQAREMGKRPLENSLEIDARAERWLEEKQVSGEISYHSDLSPEQKMEANRATYAEIQKRRAFIAQLYPVLTQNREWDDEELATVPTSIRQEFSLGDSIAKHLIVSSEQNLLGRGDIQYPNGMFLPAYHSKNDAGCFLMYEEVSKQNDGIFDQESLASFEVPQPDVEKAKAQLGEVVNKIRSTTDLKTLGELNAYSLYKKGESPEIGLTTDISAAIEWDKTDAYEIIAHENLMQGFEIRSAQEHSEVEQAQAEVAEVEEELHELDEEYRKASLLKRAQMRVFGFSRKMMALQTELERRIAVAKKLQNNWANNWERWDSESRSFRKEPGASQESE